MLALYPGPIELAKMPFANVAELLRTMGIPSPGILAHSDSLGIIALQDLGDVDAAGARGCRERKRTRRALS